MAKHSNGLIEHVIALPARACIIFTYDRGECMPYGGHGSRLNAYMLKSRRVSNKHVLYQCTSSAINRGSHTARKAKSAKRRNNELFLSQKKQLVVSSGNKETSCCPTGPKETPCCDKETKKQHDVPPAQEKHHAPTSRNKKHHVVKPAQKKHYVPIETTSCL